MFWYAQIDTDGRIVAVSQLSGEVIADYMIPIDAGFEYAPNKRYVNGQWVIEPEAETETGE